MHSTAAIIVAAGTGNRFGGEIPKTYHLLNGEAVLSHSLRAFVNHSLIDTIIIVHHADHTDYLTPILANFPQVKTVLGGETRQESVLNGLESFTNPPNKILIHDAARPLVSAELITRIVQCDAPAILPATPVTDTIRHLEHGLIDRSKLLAAQTPQGFDYQTILKLHREATTQVTDDIALAQAAGITVETIKGDPANRKITTAEDLQMMQNTPSIRVGNGYDVHGFIPHENNNKTIMICGEPIECDMAIEGHSDGDVGLHALTDAILGAIGAEDIGHHFSSDNPKWKGAASELFLKEAIRLMHKAGGKLNHADITLIAQMPKLSPHRETMRQKVADICGVELNQISVKATTTDHLGFIGRKEGLAAMATATVAL